MSEKCLKLFPNSLRCKIPLYEIFAYMMFQNHKKVEKKWNLQPMWSNTDGISSLVDIVSF